jgi:pyruvate dehydrogenase E1 component alpha subunit
MYNFSKIPEIRQLQLMILIRKAELLLAEKASQGDFKTPIHLGVGQEAIAVGISENLRKTDFIFGNHRSHAHYLAVGGSLFELFAEILGKKTGCSGGKGGSMHIASPQNGFIGSMPIVGGTIPLALGAALTARNQGIGKVAVTYFGDGAVEEGVFHESLNMASIMELPLLFVCENNLFSSHLHISERQPDQNISRFAKANFIDSIQIDGNNLSEIQSETAKLIARIRSTGKPGFIEAFTYRLYGHVGFEQDENVGLNRKKDLISWKSKDPISNFELELIRSKVISENQISEIEVDILKFVKSTWLFAIEEKYPDIHELTQNVYYEESK